MTVVIPNERLEHVRLSERDALIDIEIGLYKREEISIGRAAEVAGISPSEMLDEMSRRKMLINYDAEDVREDVRNLDVLE